MLHDPHTRAALARIRVDELIAQADAGRARQAARAAHSAPAWRLAALRLMARGLRVEREIDFAVVRSPRT